MYLLASPPLSTKINKNNVVPREMKLERRLGDFLNDEKKKKKIATIINFD